jgi:hypothetical protein
MWVWESYKVSIRWSTSALWYLRGGEWKKKSLRRKTIRSYDYCCATTPLPALCHLSFFLPKVSLPFAMISHGKKGCAPLECLNFSMLCFVWRLSVSQRYTKWCLAFLFLENFKDIEKGTWKVFLLKLLLSWGIFSIITFPHFFSFHALWIYDVWTHENS